MRFAAVIGHKSVKEKLTATAREGRVSHAQLFLGPEGAGNLAMALAYAQFLVCENREAADSCGTCPACVKMSRMVHPDVSYSYPVAGKEKIKNPKSVDFVEEWRKAVTDNPYLGYAEWVEQLDIENKQGLISVDEAADILRRLSLKAVEAPYRIVLIWCPEKMNAQSANKLLKIIEEPPVDTVFLLVASQYEQLLPTITSRTQLVKVNRLRDDELTTALVERHGLSRDDAKKVAHRSDGSYRQAQLILSEETPESDPAAQFLAWMRACLQLNVGALSKQMDEFASESRERQKSYLQFCLQIVRECVLLQYGDERLVRLEVKDLEAYRKFAPFVHTGNMDIFSKTLNDAIFHLERNANAKILFMDVSFSIHRLLQLKAVPA